MSERHIEVVEVGPRDGLQGEPRTLPIERRKAFIDRAVASGIRRLEVASFVHPKRVPQMADAEGLLEALDYDNGATYIGLVLNQRGLDRALTTPVHEIGMAVIASDTYNQKNQGVGTAESVAAWWQMAEQARAAGKRISVMLSSAFGCPFEGEVPEDLVVELAHAVMAAEPDELAIADSIGVAVPAQVTRLCRRLREAFPDVPLRCHFHNTRNTGLANAQAAVDAGASSLDASIGGIGGCPFAPAATGNIPTEDLVYLLQRSGVDTDVDLEALIKTSEWLATELDHSLPALLPRAGLFPPAPTLR
ncbi:MAG: hydroxymethylglutaryl-CoA lyase [Pseudomonadota bacterium]